MSISHLPILVSDLLERGGLSNARSAEDVLLDLSEEQGSTAGIADQTPPAKSTGKTKARNTSRRRTFLLALTLFSARMLVGVPTLPGILVSAVLCLSFSYLIVQAQDRTKSHNKTRELEFFLPIVMERIVMAVQAGHDILSAIRVVNTLDENSTSPGASPDDPVSDLLKQVTSLAETGISIEQCLNEVAQSVNSPAIRHAFIHLAQAHKEGGELIMPLRELSDSTQLYYQESIEEEIAKLPVKATLPLLCTFAGLIIFFLTSPILQIMEVTTKAMPK